MSNRKYVYKIRHTKTWLYSTGGMSPMWSKNGKVWNSIGSLKCHLRQFMKYERKKNNDGIMVTDFRVRINEIPREWEVIKIELIEIENIFMSAHHLYPEELVG